MRKQWMRGVALAGLLVAGACGDSTAPPELERIDEVAYHESLNVNLDEMTVTESGLYYQDLVVGDGALAEPGAEARVAYLLRYRTGQVVEQGEFPLTLGSGGAIAGFDEGIQGMRVGGERKLIVPPELAYGTRGPTGILIFDVELLEVTAP